MKKRISALLLAAALACALTVPALADVIWTPEDDFYTAHASACTPVNRRYCANSPEGHCGIWSEPGGSLLADAKNGTEWSVSFTYDASGVLWGLVEYDAAANPSDYLSWTEGHKSGTGWAPMSELTVIYDGQSFREEHGGEFAPYGGQFDDLLSSDDRRVIVWSYPGSGEIVGDFSHLDHGYAPSLAVDTQWTDADGRVWGRVDYYLGARGWACLSDPGNEKLPVTEHACSLYPAASGGTGASSSAEAVPAQTGDAMSTGLLFGVAAVCGVTGLLLFSLRRRPGSGD